MLNKHVAQIFLNRKSAIMKTINLPEIVLFYLNSNTMTEQVSLGPNLIDYFVDYSIEVSKLYNDKKNEGIPCYKIDPGAAERRAFTMSIFGIMSAESTRFGTLKSYQKLYPKIVLPMPEINDEVFDKGTFLTIDLKGLIFYLILF